MHMVGGSQPPRASEPRSLTAKTNKSLIGQSSLSLERERAYFSPGTAAPKSCGSQALRPVENKDSVDGTSLRLSRIRRPVCGKGVKSQSLKPLRRRGPCSHAGNAWSPGRGSNEAKSSYYLLLLLPAAERNPTAPGRRLQGRETPTLSARALRLKTVTLPSPASRSSPRATAQPSASQAEHVCNITFAMQCWSLAPRVPST